MILLSSKNISSSFVLLIGSSLISLLSLFYLLSFSILDFGIKFSILLSLLCIMLELLSILSKFIWLISFSSFRDELLSKCLGRGSYSIFLI